MGGAKYSGTNGATWKNTDLNSSACFAVAFRSRPTLYISGPVIQPGVVNVSLFLNTSATVIGNLTVMGSLTVSFGTTLKLLPGAFVSSLSLVVIGSLSMPSSVTLNVDGPVLLAPTATLVITPSTSSGLVVTVVSTYQSLNGSFSSVAVESSSCFATTVYGSSSLTVSVDLSCSSLSAGAIAGISVGSVIAAVLLILLLGAILLYFRNRRDASANISIAKREERELAAHYNM